MAAPVNRHGCNQQPHDKHKNWTYTLQIRRSDLVYCGHFSLIRAMAIYQGNFTECCSHVNILLQLL